MASNPYPDRKRGIWRMKYRPDPAGKWVSVILGHDDRLKGSRPPKLPPQPVLDRAAEFREIEYRAKHGLSAGPARAKGLDAYLNSYAETFAASHKPGSVKQTRRGVRNFLAFAKGRGVATVQAVTRAVCRDYLEYRHTTVGHETVKTEMRYLSPAWSRAVDDGLVAANPWARLKPPGKSARKEGVAWTSEEVARVATFCAKAWQSDLVMLLANTGLRISTALAMRWDWVDWSRGNRGVIQIPAEQAARRDGVKTAYAHEMSEFVHDLLQRIEFASRGKLVFPNPYRGGGEVPYDSARDAVQRAIVKAGVRPGTPHDLRRTYATLLLASGAPIDFVMRQLGHTSVATTQRYLGARPGDSEKHTGFAVGVTPPHDPSPAPGGTGPPPATPPS